MEYIRENKRYLLIIVFLSVLTNIQYLYADQKKIIPQFPLAAIRYLDPSGTNTYFERSNGELILSANFNLKSLVKSDHYGHITVTNSSYSEKILIEMFDHFYTNMDLYKNNKIYFSKLGDTQVTLLGYGTQPKLHLEDSWVSFLDFKDKKLQFESFEVKGSSFSIQLKYENNYYMPVQRVMIDQHSILYVDKNKENIKAIVLLDRKTNEVKVLYKTKSPQIHMEICYGYNKFYILETSYEGSFLKYLELTKSKDFRQLEELYSSKRKDRGQLVCAMDDNKVYFIKDIETGSYFSQQFEIYQLDVPTKKGKILSNLKYVTSNIAVNNQLLVSTGKDYFWVSDK